MVRELGRLVITKEQAGYRYGMASPQCANCVMYRSGSCDLVMGLIEAYALCDYWEPSTGDVTSVAEHLARNGVDHVAPGL